MSRWLHVKELSAEKRRDSHEYFINLWNSSLYPLHLTDRIRINCGVISGVCCEELDVTKSCFNH